MTLVKKLKPISLKTAIHEEDNLNNILNDIDQREKNLNSKRKSIILITLTFLFIGLNLFLCFKNIPDHPVSQNGKIISRRDNMVYGVSAILLLLPIMAFIISLPASLIPYKKVSYKKKYLPFTLIILLIIQFILFVLFILPQRK